MEGQRGEGIINSDETAKTPQRGNGTIDSRRSLESESKLGLSGNSVKRGGIGGGGVGNVENVLWNEVQKRISMEEVFWH